MHTKSKTSTPERIIRIGDVTIVARELTARESRKQIAASQRVARKLAHILTIPGLPEINEPGIPQFHADPTNPRYLIRVLDGIAERGTIKNGVFLKLREK